MGPAIIPEPLDSTKFFIIPHPGGQGRALKVVSTALIPARIKWGPEQGGCFGTGLRHQQHPSDTRLQILSPPGGLLFLQKTGRRPMHKSRRRGHPHTVLKPTMIPGDQAPATQNRGLRNWTSGDHGLPVTPTIDFLFSGLYRYQANI